MGVGTPHAWVPIGPGQRGAAEEGASRGHDPKSPVTFKQQEPRGSLGTQRLALCMGGVQSIPLQAGQAAEEVEALGEAPVRGEQPACTKHPPEGVEKSSAEAFLNPYTYVHACGCAYTYI